MKLWKKVEGLKWLGWPRQSLWASKGSKKCPCRIEKLFVLAVSCGLVAWTSLCSFALEGPKLEGWNCILFFLQGGDPMLLNARKTEFSFRWLPNTRLKQGQRLLQKHAHLSGGSRETSFYGPSLCVSSWKGSGNVNVFWTCRHRGCCGVFVLASP